MLAGGPSPLLVCDEFLEAFDGTHGEAQRRAVLGVVDPEAAILGLSMLAENWFSRTSRAAGWLFRVRLRT